MNQTAGSESFENVLLGHVEMCYGVAFALTHDPYAARELTQRAVTWAWHRRDPENGATGIKTNLLTALREHYLQHYRHPPLNSGNNATIAERP